MRLSLLVLLLYNLPYSIIKRGRLIGPFTLIDER